MTFKQAHEKPARWIKMDYILFKERDPTVKRNGWVFY
jgi:hypothetical protein